MFRLKIFFMVLDWAFPSIYFDKEVKIEEDKGTGDLESLVITMKGREEGVDTVP